MEFWKIPQKKAYIINAYVFLTRGKLYDEVWQTSIQGVASKYNLNYDNLFRKFRDEKIPHPDNSYLAKKENGEDVSQDIPPLEGDPEKPVKLLSNKKISPAQFALQDRSEQLQELHRTEALDFLLVAEKENVLKEISVICIQDDNPVTPAVAAYITINRRKFSENGSERAKKVLSSLVSSLVKLGASSSSLSEQGYFLSYRNTTLQLQMKERTTQYKRSLKDLQENPKFPRFEQRFNGRLELNVSGEVFADDDDYTLEYQLGRILQAAIEKSEEILNRTRDGLSLQQEGEQAFQKINALYRDADAHDRAKRIRTYVQDVLLNNFDDPDVRKWAQWALEQADQLDPPPQNSGRKTRK